MQYIIRNIHENYTAINNAFLQDSKENGKANRRR